jgi:hypothetical protein
MLRGIHPPCCNEMKAMVMQESKLPQNQTVHWTLDCPVEDIGSVNGKVNLMQIDVSGVETRIQSI